MDNYKLYSMRTRLNKKWHIGHDNCMREPMRTYWNILSSYISKFWFDHLSPTGGKRRCLQSWSIPFLVCQPDEHLMKQAECNTINQCYVNQKCYLNQKFYVKNPNVMWNIMLWKILLIPICTLWCIIVYKNENYSMKKVS